MSIANVFFVLMFFYEVESNNGSRRHGQHLQLDIILYIYIYIYIMHTVARTMHNR